MNQNILDYIASQRVCVLAVEMLDGGPHAATLHFAETSNADKFYFLTTPTYRKVEALTGRKNSRASVVIGVSEDDMKTIQMDGVVELVGLAEEVEFNTVYYGKFSDKAGKFSDDLMFKFTPTWWRFTDWTTPEGKKIISSED